MLKRGVVLLAWTGLFTLSCLVSAYLWTVVFFPGEEISQANIEKILAMESPVYYADGRSKVGVFFEDAHRQYVPYEAVPRNFINAIVAAEDSDFFSHHGIDVLGILRAVVANVKAGRVVQGGSTITQQTAKNLFKRSDRSLKAKVKELLYALRLEYHYPKEKILEFYVNQFYVSGNGHGLGVAANYYFDKQVSDLSLLECAFIAGSVKRPNYYNPFTKKDEEAALLARRRAKARATYVLGRMNKLQMISAAAYRNAIKEEINFKKGTMFYALNTLMDQVRAGLDCREVQEALDLHGINNVATSGIRVFTTVDKGLQEKTLFALRKELSRLDIRLRGYEREEVQAEYGELKLSSGSRIEPGTFLMGTVLAVEDSESPSIQVTIGRNSTRGKIDEKGMQTALLALMRWLHHRWTVADSSDIHVLLERIQEGDRIFVSVRAVDEESGELLLDLEKYPRLQGGALVMQNGTVKAMAGGMENHFFNRAMAAKRPMGSVMKPLVYAAALQLGWNSLDPLSNRRDVFVYQKQAYFPRPDHQSPHAEVSMNWAGVHSENLASIWLLYHLCDRLTPAQFKEVLSRLGLARQGSESYGSYQQRIRDRYGIQVDENSLRQAAFTIAVKNLEPDFVFNGQLEEYRTLQNLHYGTDFDRFYEEAGELIDDEQELSPAAKLRLQKEIELRRRILRKNYLHYMALRAELRSMQDASKGYAETMMDGRLYRNPATDSFVYTDQFPAPKGLRSVSRRDLAKLLSSSNNAEQFWDKVLIDGSVTAGVLDMVEKSLEQEFARLSSLPPYSPEVLHNIPDFRVLASLHYLVAFGRALGIRSRLEPVLSFPLGSNVISLYETAKAYEGIVTGRVIESSAENSEALSVIDRIEDIDGQLIFKPGRRTRRVVDGRTSLAVSNILQNVIKYGTGRYADRQIRLSSRDPETAAQLAQLDLHLPLLGKTGTANRFINSSFSGFVPAPMEGTNTLSVANGFSVAAYVGFDDNSPMVKGTTHITGAGGGLPVWTRIVDAVVLENDYAENFDLVDLAFAPELIADTPSVRLAPPEMEQVGVEVDRGTGLPADGTKDEPVATVLTFGVQKTKNEFEPARFFSPFWQLQ
jgi:membrane peptidoglycan carboxypeptidase